MIVAGGQFVPANFAKGWLICADSLWRQVMWPRLYAHSALRGTACGTFRATWGLLRLSSGNSGRRPGWRAKRSTMAWFKPSIFSLAVLPSGDLFMVPEPGQPP